MTTYLKEWTMDPFDIVWKNFFDGQSNFNTLQQKINYPVDIYENKKGLHFEIACTGLEKSDVNISIEGDTLKISYVKTEDKCCDVNECTYIHKGIARRSFSLGYKVASKYDLSKAEAEMKNGLLKISIPYADTAKPLLLKIK